MALKDEILKIVVDSSKSANKETALLLKVYKKQLDSVRQQIADITLKYTVDGALSVSKTQRLKELKSLKQQLEQQAHELYKATNDTTTKLVTETAENAYYNTLYQIDKGVADGVKVSPLKPEFVKQVATQKIEGKTFSDRIWKNTTDLANRVQRDVEQALIQGTSPEKLARQIKKDYGSTAYQAQRLINTEVAKAVTSAQKECYSNSGVVQSVMWDATLEDNTCDECADYDGNIYPLDSAPALPAHPDCRCALIPYISGWKPTSKRENIVDPDTGEKKIIDYSTVKDWRESRDI